MKKITDNQYLDNYMKPGGRLLHVQFTGKLDNDLYKYVEDNGMIYDMVDDLYDTILPPMEVSKGYTYKEFILTEPTVKYDIVILDHIYGGTLSRVWYDELLYTTLPNYLNPDAKVFIIDCPFVNHGDSKVMIEFNIDDLAYIVTLISGSYEAKTTTKGSLIKQDNVEVGQLILPLYTAYNILHYIIKNTGYMGLQDPIIRDNPSTKTSLANVGLSIIDIVSLQDDKDIATNHPWITSIKSLDPDLDVTNELHVTDRIIVLSYK